MHGIPFIWQMECADFQWMTQREVLSLSLSLSLSPRKLDVIYSQNTPVPSLPLCRLGAGISPNGNLRAAFSSLSSDLWPRMAEAADPTELREEDCSVRHSSRSQVARTTRAFHAKCPAHRSSSFPLSLTVIIAISAALPPSPRVIYLTIL